MQELIPILVVLVLVILVVIVSFVIHSKKKTLDFLESPDLLLSIIRAATFKVSPTGKLKGLRRSVESIKTLTASGIRIVYGVMTSDVSSEGNITFEVIEIEIGPPHRKFFTFQIYWAETDRDLFYKVPGRKKGKILKDVVKTSRHSEGRSLFLAIRKIANQTSVPVAPVGLSKPAIARAPKPIGPPTPKND